MSEMPMLGTDSSTLSALEPTSTPSAQPLPRYCRVTSVVYCGESTPQRLHDHNSPVNNLQEQHRGVSEAVTMSLPLSLSTRGGT